MLVGDWFHSHNWIIESFYSAGVPGLVLAFAVFAALPAFCHRRTIVVAAVYASSLAVVTMVWFQLSSTIPFMALAMAAVAGGSATPVVLRRVRAPAAIVAPTVLVILMLAQSAAAAALLSFGLKVSATLAVYETPPSANADLHFPRDFRGAEFAFAKAVRERIVVLKEAKLKAGDPETESQRSVMRAIFEDLEARIDDRDSPFLVLAGIAAISDIMYDPALAWLKPDYVARTGLWGRWIATFLRQAPMRSDVAIAYFGWLLAEGRTDDVARIAGGILRDSPQDAVALYHLGAALIIDQDANKRNLALAYLRQGFDNGIERFMKIEPTLKAMILKAR